VYYLNCAGYSFFESMRQNSLFIHNLLEGIALLARKRKHVYMHNTSEIHTLKIHSQHTHTKHTTKKTRRNLYSHIPFSLSLHIRALSPTLSLPCPVGYGPALGDMACLPVSLYMKLERWLAGSVMA
jgi:hypothetical protein